MAMKVLNFGKKLSSLHGENAEMLRKNWGPYDVANRFLTELGIPYLEPTAML